VVLEVRRGEVGRTRRNADGAEHEQARLHYATGLEAAMRQQAVVADRDAEPWKGEEPEEECELRPADPLVPQQPHRVDDGDERVDDADQRRELGRARRHDRPQDEHDDRHHGQRHDADEDQAHGFTEASIQSHRGGRSKRLRSAG